MIVKNEEAVLKRCLDSIIDLYDELIIVDTGSTDGTMNIASEYTNQLYRYTWNGDFSAARNHSISFASCDYIFYLDADEYLSAENHRRFAVLKKAILPEIDII